VQVAEHLEEQVAGFVEEAGLVGLLEERDRRLPARAEADGRLADRARGAGDVLAELA
jgi:hypothetical protein